MQLKPNIHVDVQQHTVAFKWPDKDLLISHQQLREICPCGFCKAKRLRHQAVVDAHTVQVTAMFDQGYGAQICFSDGHDQGIFPWVFLKNLDL
ncbi:MAG TPA: DUF971 domain-containing protein [Acinetobacter ursingii]|jgi:hypothetical protein|uniref:Gamma-butyrobetaine hydroxylase-like domain-containing protein n=1 Tax=Acinetobacter ursingii TaxID=108980 RepID=A0A2N6VAJ7_9GAMM|nr:MULTISPECIES: gamma-butyrobetaine hydroxylase-like domain-containing protein [Acinetobacter]ENV75889.1 hypothetical protein F944_01760 [Acinetobacter ursingii DSM 16037 = CIP 107286]MCH2006202.1 gamma-butyrobetaine hydroxylase-like domain-containing protein [Acinetobacter ursingii]MCU4350371.1 DUF971 domain-containing protein [Acinetobacter ursingii]MCU4382447.1 DUF971 domain-containing protein [Acinetobacter ursingii]MCU4489645.1 DUF971 domain-containing protein [Acinetobacter ursingii]